MHGMSEMANLVKALGNQDEDARANTALALSEMGESASEAVPTLIQALGDERSRRTFQRSVSGLPAVS